MRKTQAKSKCPYGPAKGMPAPCFRMHFTVVAASDDSLYLKRQGPLPDRQDP